MPALRFLSIVTLFFICSENITAQIEASIFASSNNMFNDSHESIKGYSYTSLSHIQDSTWVRYRNEVTSVTSYNFTEGHSLSVVLKLSKPIGKNLMLTSGIGFNLGGFKINEAYSSQVAIVDSVNIIADPPAASIPSISNFNDNCDTHTNSSWDIGLIPGHSRTNFSLLFPLELEYFFLDSGFSASLGLYFRTPFLALRLDDRVSKSEVLEGNEVVCTWYREEFVDNSGENVRNAIIGGSANLNYTFDGGLGIHLGYLQDFSDFFVDAEYQGDNFRGSGSASLHMRRRSVGIRYTFPNNRNQVPTMPFNIKE